MSDPQSSARLLLRELDRVHGSVMLFPAPILDAMENLRRALATAEPPEKFALQAVIPGAEEPTPDDLAALWNHVTTGRLPAVMLPLRETRRRECRKALRRRPLDGPEGWKAAFERFSKSAGAVGRPWATFDFAIRDEGRKGESAEKILAGLYDRDYDKPAGPRVQTPEENAAKWKELEGKSDIDF